MNEVELLPARSIKDKSFNFAVIGYRFWSQSATLHSYSFHFTLINNSLLFYSCFLKFINSFIPVGLGPGGMEEEMNCGLVFSLRSKCAALPFNQQTNSSIQSTKPNFFGLCWIGGWLVLMKEEEQAAEATNQPSTPFLFTKEKLRVDWIDLLVAPAFASFTSLKSFHFISRFSFRSFSNQPSIKKIKFIFFN